MINCVVAVEQGQGIGFNGLMPWPHLKGDMSWFKQLTTDNVVIMGSTTWASLGKALPNRINMVVSRWAKPGADHRYFSLEDAIYASKFIYPEKEIFIIGGQALYDSAMSLVDKFYVTEIQASYQCDKFFNLDYVKQTCPLIKEHVQYTEPIPYNMKEYSR